MAEQSNNLDERVALLRVQVDQLKAQVEELRAQADHMCGDSPDLAKARQFVLDQVMILGKSWIDTCGVLMARGSAAGKLLGERVDEAVRHFYKEGGRPSKNEIFRLLHDSAFMAFLRHDYLQRGRKITSDPHSVK